MSCELALDDMVTYFLLNTCRLCPRYKNPHAVWAALCSSLLADRQSKVDTERTVTTLTTGSVAEFYIEPILPHVGDIDVMFHLSTELAIPCLLYTSPSPRD